MVNYKLSIVNGNGDWHLSVARSGDRPQQGMASPLLADNGAIIAKGGKENGRYPNNQNSPTGNSFL